MGSGGIIFKTYTGGIVDVPEFPVGIECNNQLLCYPVPSSYLINVKVDYENQTYPEKIIVYDTYGRQISNEEILPNQKSIQINISGLKVGIYLVPTITDSQIIRSAKIIKSN
ncbi:MAG: T9SS type A sorting domain-containing protein [Bacteroidetes bacterium]|nr:T9SS type A sorting domain-containing protein [Bacteroidota bacterium]